MPKAFDKLWTIAMNGNIFRLTCSLGLALAVLAVGFWCVKFYKTLQEGNLQPAITEMIFPLILVILLSNNGANMRDLTMTARNALNGINKSVAVVMSAEADLQTAINATTGSGAIRQVINSMFNTCNATNQVSDFQNCMAVKAVAAKAFVRDRTTKWQSNNPNSNQGVEFQARVTDIVNNLLSEVDEQLSIRNTIQASQVASNQNVPNNNGQNVTPNGNPQPTIFDIKNDDDAAVYNKAITSFRKAFLYIVEVMMLVTGLVGPIFLGLSLFPVTNKPFIPWAISFLSLGFCKICYTLIAGLAAVAMVFNGPGTDMLVVSTVIGLLAPVLAFSIASGSGLAALTQVSYSAQNFGLNNGIAVSPIAGVPVTAVQQQQQENSKPRVKNGS
jgi:hypothetical protein